MVFLCRKCDCVVVASRDGPEAWAARVCRLCHKGFAMSMTKEMSASAMNTAGHVAWQAELQNKPHLRKGTRADLTRAWINFANGFEAGWRAAGGPIVEPMGEAT